MDQTSFNEFKATEMEKIILENAGFGPHDGFSFGIHEDENSISVQRRNAYLMEVNNDFEIQHVLSEFSWTPKLTE